MCPPRESLRMRVLVIGDSQEVMKGIFSHLRLRWLDAIIISVARGFDAVGLVEAEAPDLVLVDSSLRDMGLLDLVKRIRKLSDVPLIVLATAPEIHEVQVLEAGADDCVVPYSAEKVLAKVDAFLRRSQGLGLERGRAWLVKGSVAINLPAREVFVSGKQVSLSPHEYDMLVQLVRNEGRVLSHRTLLRGVWGSERGKDIQYVKNYIVRLRRKIEGDSTNPQMILTERGIGYKFVSSE